MDKLTVGQVLYRAVSERGKPIEIKEYVIGKIGNKYFYLQGYDSRYPIEKATLMHVNKDFSKCNFQLYLTKQEILDKLECESLFMKLKKATDRYYFNKEFTLTQLREASKALGLI